MKKEDGSSGSQLASILSDHEEHLITLARIVTKLSVVMESFGSRIEYIGTLLDRRTDKIAQRVTTIEQRVRIIEDNQRQTDDMK